MRRSLEALAADETTAGVREQTCKDAARRDADFGALRAALVSCYVEFGNRLQFEGGVVDRGSALQLLHVIPEPARRKALFDAFVPLWTALNGPNEADSPYRRMIVMAAADASKRGSEVDAAARAIGVETGDIERWLVQILEAWREASPAEMVEPWDYRYLNSSANRQLEAKIPAQSLLPANERFYRDLGADLAQARRRLRPRAAAGQVTARVHGFPQAGQGGWQSVAEPGRSRGRDIPDGRTLSR